MTSKRPTASAIDISRTAGAGSPVAERVERNRHTVPKVRDSAAPTHRC